MGGGQEKGKERTNSALPFLFLPFAEISAIRMLPAAGRGPVSARCHLLTRGGGEPETQMRGAGERFKGEWSKAAYGTKRKTRGKGSQMPELLHHFGFK